MVNSQFFCTLGATPLVLESAGLAVNEREQLRALRGRRWCPPS